MTYSYLCLQCEREQDLSRPYSERDNPATCDCGGSCKRIPCNFSLGAGMYHQKTTSINKKNDMISELRSIGVEKISASNQGFDATCKSLLSEKSRVSDQMAMGAERQKNILAEKVKAAKPSAGEVKRLEKIFSEKNVPRGTNKKPK